MQSEESQAGRHIPHSSCVTLWERKKDRDKKQVCVLGGVRGVFEGNAGPGDALFPSWVVAEAQWPDVFVTSAKLHSKEEFSLCVNAPLNEKLKFNHDTGTGMCFTILFTYVCDFFQN
jgi:hypothetical protein